MKWRWLIIFAIVVMGLFYYLKMPKYETIPELSIVDSYWWLPPESAIDAPRKTDEAGTGTPIQVVIILKGEKVGFVKIDIMRKEFLSPLFDWTYDSINVGSVSVSNMHEVRIDYNFEHKGQYYAYVYWDGKLIHRISDIRIIIGVEYVRS